MFPSRRSLFLVALSMVVFSHHILFAQSGRSRETPPPSPVVSSAGQNDDVITKVRTNEVFLPVTVLNEYGTYTPGLGQNDFIVVEDDKRQEITSLRQGAPLRMVLLLDVSASFFDSRSETRTAALEMVENMGLDDQMCVIQFGDGVQVLQDWTGSRRQLSDAIQSRYRSGPYNALQTHFWDALAKAAEKLRQVRGRRTILMATDAYGIGSKLQFEDAQKAVVQANAGLYVLSSSEAVERAPKPTPWCGCGGVGGETIAGKSQGQAVRWMRETEQNLTQLATETGGHLTRVLKNGDLAAGLRNTINELHGQYVLTYLSSNEADAATYRKISVLMARPGFKVITREGYFFPGNEK
ncbi:MAG: VWA domain-containing protein [Blastocatellia bacterium]|nr:VWA domain-containing protein [Blastocatellia bacterium]